MIKQVAEGIMKSYDKCVNRLKLRYKHVEYAPDLYIDGVLRLYGRGRIVIGKQVHINSSEKSNPLGGSGHSLFSLAHGGELIIGDGVGISNTAIVCHNRVTIEDNVRIGGNTKIYDTDFHSLSYEERTGSGKENAVTRPVRIKKGAFIGAHCIILKGVTIGEKSIVGAGSVVTKDIPDGEIWGGNPARRIRKIDEQRR